MIRLDSCSPITQIGDVIDALRRSAGRRDELVALLPERLPIYQRRTAADVTRIRGYLLAAFADTGLPPDAMPYVIESLQSGHTAYEVAGAAIGLRGLAETADDLPRRLLQAIDTLPEADRSISFENIDARWPYLQPTTALTVIIRTISHFGVLARPVISDLEALGTQSDRFSAAVLMEIRMAAASIRAAEPEPQRFVSGCAGCPVSCRDCHGCEAAVQTHQNEPATGDSCCEVMTFQNKGAGDDDGDDVATTAVSLEDQDGRRTKFDDFYRGATSLVAFFYTRCDNPYKCTLTVTKLAAIQAALDQRMTAGSAMREPRVRITAISYDPEFDLPHRLRRYGIDRGIRFDENTRFFRVTTGNSLLRKRFGLGVNYGGSTVNRHRTELYVLDSAGSAVASFTRVQWTVDEVLAILHAVQSGDTLRVPVG